MKITNQQLHQEMLTMKQDIRDIKLRLLDPDKGTISRVNKNTSMRKVLVKAMWVIYTITLGALIKIFTE